jgi:hypothetical protein
MSKLVSAAYCVPNGRPLRLIRPFSDVLGEIFCRRTLTLVPFFANFVIREHKKEGFKISKMSDFFGDAIMQFLPEMRAPMRSDLVHSGNI